jgi:predicted phage terminase large subunit-like protein
MDILSKKAHDKFFREELLISPPTSSQGDELRGFLRENGIKSLYFFATAILKWDLLQEDPHLPMCSFIQTPNDPPLARFRKVLLVPRDCYKSTIGSKSLPLWYLIQPMLEGIPGREHRILLCSSASTNAMKQIKSIQTQVERNQILSWVYPEIIPDLSRTTWTQSNLLFPRDGMYGEDTIEAAGVDSHIVSRHYTIQIKDDLEDKQSFEQPSVREKVKSFYKSAEALFVDEQTSIDILIGTRWGIDDLYADIKESESGTYAFYTRPLHWTQEDLKRDIRQAEEVGKPPIYDMIPEESAPEAEKTYYFFPKLFPEESCERIKRKQGSFMYSMLYMNNPRDPALAEFRETDLRYFSFDKEGNLVIEDTDNAKFDTVSFDSLTRVMFWDPALAERELKKRSRNAMIVMARDNRSRLFILDAYAEYKNPGFLFSKFISLHQKHRVHKAAIEDAGFQRILKFPLYQRMKELNYHFPVEGEPPIGDKDARIRSLIPYVETHDLFIRRGLTDFVEEIRGFPVFPTKDLVDGAAACLAVLSKAGDAKQTASSPFQARHHRHLQAVNDQALSTRSPMTGY